MQSTPRGRPRTTATKLARLAAHLTDRDRHLARLVHEHQVLTTTQLAEVAFDSLDRAEDRLRALTGLEVLDRFRPRRSTGSAPFHYVLGPLGALVLAAERGIDGKQLGWRRDKALAVAHGQRLAHTVGVNGFFTALVAHARRSRADTELTAWWSERRCRDHWGRVVRPDGYGRWRQHQTEVDFFVEYDTGSEPLAQVTAKLAGYEDLAAATDLWTPTLFWVRSPGREASLREAFARSRSPVNVATAHPLGGRGPAEAVWLPINERGPRRPLIDLADSVSWQKAATGTTDW